MSHDGWMVIALLAIGTFAIKAAGPAILGGRPLPERLNGVIALLAPALLAGLVISESFTGARPEHLVIDPRTAGLIAAAAALWMRLPLPVTLAVAAAAAAVTRLV
jgi:Branched-chain amino acid transport protein (AzlD)